MEFEAGETIVFTIPGSPTSGDDLQGNPNVGAATTLTIEGVGVSPLVVPGSWRSSDETQESYGSRSVTGYLLMLPYGTTIPANATATVRGVAGWQVQAGSADTDWRDPWDGEEFGTTVTVRKAS